MGAAILIVEIFRYGIIGFGTTVINFILDFLLRYVGVPYQISIIVAWFIAVIFAYWGNKFFVFSITKKAGNTFIKFMASRVGTLVIEEVLSFVMISMFDINQVLAKLFIQFVVIILNYIFGVMIFKGRKHKDGGEICLNEKKKST